MSSAKLDFLAALVLLPLLFINASVIATKVAPTQKLRSAFKFLINVMSALKEDAVMRRMPK
jgi:hypothetical protein